MEFVSFEDTTAIYEATFFPQAYERFCNMLTTARPYLLGGRVNEDFGAFSLIVDEVGFLDRPTGRPVKPGTTPAKRKGADIRASGHYDTFR